MPTQINTSEIKVQAYTIGYLATLYNVSRNTFKKWLRPHLNDIGERTGWYYTSKQVSIIFEKLGEP
jgi:hypothetical protein